MKGGGVLCQHGLHADGVVARVRWQCSTSSHVDADRLWGAQHRAGTGTGDSVAWVGRKGRVMEIPQKCLVPTSRGLPYPWRAEGGRGLPGGAISSTLRGTVLDVTRWAAEAGA